MNEERRLEIKKRRTELEEKIIKVLDEHPDGLTLKEISKKIGGPYSYIDLEIVLSKLCNEAKISLKYRICT